MASNFLNPSTKKWITVAALVLLSAVNITSPYNLREMIPVNVLTYLSWISYAGLVAGYWIINKEVD